MSISVIKNKAYGGGRAVLIVLLCVFGFMRSSDPVVVKSCGMSLAEYVLFAISDHYYLMYGWFIVIFYDSARRIRRNGDVELVRYGTYRKYYIVEIAATVLRLFVLIALHVVAATALGIIFGLPFSGSFLAKEVEGYYSGNVELIFAFREYFATPLVAVLESCVYLLLGSVFIYTLLFFANQLKGDKGIFLAGALVICSTVLGFVTSVDESLAEIFFLNNYFIFHHALLTYAPWVVLLNIAVMLLLTTFGICFVRGGSDGRRRRRWEEK